MWSPGRTKTGSEDMLQLRKNYVAGRMTWVARFCVCGLRIAKACLGQPEILDVVHEFMHSSNRQNADESQKNMGTVGACADRPQQDKHFPMRAS